LEKVILEWQGPVGIGNAVTFGEYEFRSRPHIYIFQQEFPEVSRTVVYVGKANNLEKRVFGNAGHILSFLSLCYNLRDRNSEVLYRPSNQEYFKALESIDKFLPIALENTRRLKFFYARCDQKKLLDVEAPLTRRFREDLTDSYICDNARTERAKTELNIQHVTKDSNVQAALEGLIDISLDT